MARLTRKELKTDKFALEVEQTVTFFEEHRREIVRYGAAALAVIVIATAVYFYRKQQRAARQEALAQAILVQDAPVGAPSPNYPVSFATQQEKDKEAVRQFADIAAKYSGTGEGAIAQYYLGCIRADQGNLAEAEKNFKSAIDSGDANYASLAKLALAQIYYSSGRAQQGETLLRELIAKPTMLVTADQATLALARQLVKTNPAEAKRLLEPLRSSRNSAVSQVAIQTYSEIMAP